MSVVGLSATTKGGTASASVTVASVSPSSTLFGASGGAWGVATMIGKVSPKVVRAFNPGDAAAAKGLSIVYSNDSAHGGGGSDLIGVTSITAAAAQSWLAELETALADKTKPHFVIWDHEDDIKTNDPARLERIYAGGKVVLDELRRLGWNVKSVVCTTGMPYGLSQTDPAGYGRWNLPSAEVIGVDNYSRSHWSTIRAFAKSVGKPWGIPENAIKAGAIVSPPYTDQQVKDALVQDFTSAGGEAAFFCYWPNWNGDLTNRPLATAQLKAYCTA